MARSRCRISRPLVSRWTIQAEPLFAAKLDMQRRFCATPPTFSHRLVGRADLPRGVRCNGCGEISTLALVTPCLRPIPPSRFTDARCSVSKALSHRSYDPSDKRQLREII